MDDSKIILTEEALAKIRWNIDFINEEVCQIDVSDEAKKETISACNSFAEEVFLKFGTEISQDELIKLIKENLKSFDEIIERINGSEKDKTLFMLLITHIADIKFLLLDKEEQDKIRKEFEEQIESE